MSREKLTAKHLSLLIALQEGPMDRLEVLAKKIGLSRTTVSNDLKWLSGEGANSSKRFFRVVPDLDEDKLGLQTVDVFITTPDYDSMVQVESLCDKHPYTKYRARYYGGGSGVFAQFRIPKGTSRKLDRFLKGTKSDGLFESYSILPTANIPSLFTLPRIENWNNENFTWDFDWTKWWNDGSEGLHILPPETTKAKLDLLTKNDVAILSVLPKGARRKNKLIIDELRSSGVNFSSQEFSRRMQLLKDEFIKQYHVYIDIEAFDLYSNVLITANSTPKFTAELRGRILSCPMPFRSTLRLTDSFLFWYLRLPPSHLSSLLTYLHERVANLRLSMVDYQKTDVYGLWAEAFDEDAHTWRSDDDFMSCRFD